jgi:hypothetical protein
MGYMIKIKKDHNPLINMEWDFDDEFSSNEQRQNIKDLLQEYTPEQNTINDVYSAFDGYDFKQV